MERRIQYCKIINAQNMYGPRSSEKKNLCEKNRHSPATVLEQTAELVSVYNCGCGFKTSLV